MNSSFEQPISSKNGIFFSPIIVVYKLKFINIHLNVTVTHVDERAQACVNARLRTSTSMHYVRRRTLTRVDMRGVKAPLAPSYSVSAACLHKRRSCCPTEDVNFVRSWYQFIDLGGMSGLVRVNTLAQGC